MNSLDISVNSNYYAKLYREIPFTAEDLKKIEGKITKECRKYLIGKFCEHEKNNFISEIKLLDIYSQIGQNFGYTGASMKNLIAYTRAIDNLYILSPGVVSAILAGKTRLPYKNVTLLAKMKTIDIRIIMKRLACEKTSAEIIFKEQKEQSEIKKKRGRPRRNFPDSPRISVKDLPPYDPDSQVMALVYTIPSWVGMIDKTFMNTDFRKISQTAQGKFSKELTELRDIVDTMIAILEENK